MGKPTYIDLFCGAGGLSLGFNSAGFKNLFSLDCSESHCRTYEKNFPKHSLVQKDIANLSKKDIGELTFGKDVDLIIGGPPCQGFSMAGNIGRTFVDDPRNHLFKEFARVVKLVKPKMFVIENVARLYTHNKGKTRNEIIATFEKMGYKVDCKVLCASDFGVPQARKRVIFIGNRLGRVNQFPLKTQDIPISVKDAIKDLPSLKSGEKSSNIPNHEAMNHSKQMLNKMKHVSDGGDRSDIPLALRPASGDVRKYIRYSSKEPAVCITGDMRKVFHYEQNRALTVRELARIQSFPDSFVFEGNRISQQQQVGDAVPPLLAEAIAKTIKEELKNDS